MTDSYLSSATIKKALLFINGEPPEKLPRTDRYEVISCTDGAFSYLKKKGFNLHALTFISGDFDSLDQKVIIEETAHLLDISIIHTPDQNKTDFHKALEILVSKGIESVDVYGGSCGEMDHFLGNLTVANSFKESLIITFFDAYSQYFFAPERLVLNGVFQKTISLYPFPLAEHVVSTGLKWCLERETLDITAKIGTRNIAEHDEVTISFDAGALVVFVSH